MTYVKMRLCELTKCSTAPEFRPKSKAEIRAEKAARRAEAEQRRRKMGNWK